MVGYHNLKHALGRGVLQYAPTGLLRHLFVAVLVLFLAAFVRFYHLDSQSLWNDEGNSLRLAERSTGNLIDAAGRDIHPPGYYLVLKGWIALAGESEFSLRALSAFEGVIAVAVTIALGRALFSRAAGSVAGLLVALSPFAVYYSQETRMYAQVGLLSVASMAVLVGWLCALPHSPVPSPHVERGRAVDGMEVPSPTGLERGLRGEVNHLSVLIS